MFVRPVEGTRFEDAWLEGDPSARWLSATGHGAGSGADASGSSLLEVPGGCRLPRHVDSAEETIVVTAGAALISVGEEEAEVSVGGIALVPANVPHEVRNRGDQPLRFAAVYAAAEVETTYEEDVMPDGSRRRRPVG